MQIRFRKSNPFGMPCVLLCAMALPTAAIAQTQSHVDLTGTAGYSQNPFLLQGADGSFFGRISAAGYHSIRGERGETDLSGYVENTTYLKDYGSKQIFDLHASTRYQVSELVEMFANAQFSGDIGGQLINRFNTVPNAPPPPEPGGVEPPPGDSFDANVLNLNRRQYRLVGQAGATLTLSARDTLTVAGSGQYVFFSKDSDDLNYSVVTGTVAWQREFSERTTGGAQMSVQRANYPGPDHNSTVFNPQLTLHTLLSGGWEANVAGGLSVVHRNSETGDDKSVNPSADFEICRTTESQRYCGRGSYSTQTASTQEALQTTTAGIDYFNRLDLKNTIQARLGYIHYSGGNFGTEVTGTNYYTGGMSFSHKFSDRFSTGADAGARKAVQNSTGTIPFDFTLSAFVRYRLGDLM